MRKADMRYAHALCILLILLFTAQVQTPLVQHSSLDKSGIVMQAGTPVRIEVTSPTSIITADEVMTLSASMYDALNNLVSGEVVWSSSNGSMTSDGVFYPWSSGTITIEASFNGLVGSLNISVTPGAGQSLEITSHSGSVLVPVILTVDVLDARGNSQPSSTAVWTVDGVYAGEGSPSWTPLDIGVYELRARLFQMEHIANIVISAGNPYEFILPQGLQVRSGESILVTPLLLDANGFEMNHTAAGTKSWEVENGSILPSGRFVATHPGLWMINVSAGDVKGAGTIRVVPADASLSQVVVLSELVQFTAGTPYEVAALRTDSLGYTGTITPPLMNFTVSSGGISSDGDAIHWTPGSMGMHTISVIDGGVFSSLDVEVVHGHAIETILRTSSSNLIAGEQTTLSHMAMDVAGNQWLADGTFTVANGDESLFTAYSGYATVTPHEAMLWRIETTWFDQTTDTRFDALFQAQSQPGRLSFIQLNGEGSVVKSDTPFVLEPMFYGGYSNEVTGVSLNWTIDGVDETVEILLSGLTWTPTSVGEHEIRANADGVFATVRLTVVAGSARNLVTDYEDGLVVKAGIPTELFIQTMDAHGNLAPATNISTTLSPDFGVLTASSSGNGYWDFVGQKNGAYSLEFIQDAAIHQIPLTIEAGQAIRLISSIESENIAQGDTVLLRVRGVDAYNNSVAIDPDNTTISCTSGPDKHITSDTWELKISSAGNDRSCNILWNTLISQNYFDVEPVLLGGAVGSTNTAMVLGSFMLALILITLVVLVRRANLEVDEYDDDDDEKYDIDDDELLNAQPISNEELTEEMYEELAAKAAEVGVMQAAPGTVQGESGWYVDVDREIQYWNVGEDGSWTKLG
ncbi:MAG: hypothetical protein CMA63_05455 [Euryarchaeota archaeon]|nr:hypothetical protein [Euryarchaeota archaeon]